LEVGTLVSWTKAATTHARFLYEELGSPWTDQQSVEEMTRCMSLVAAALSIMVMLTLETSELQRPT